MPVGGRGSELYRSRPVTAHAEVRHSDKGIAIGSGMAAAAGAAAGAASLRDAPRNPFEMGEVWQGIHWGEDAEGLKQQHKEPAPETDKTWPTERRGGKTAAVFSEAYTDTKGLGWRYWYLGRRWVSRNERSGWRDLLKWTRGKEASDARKRAEVWREGQRVKRMKTVTLAGVDYTPGDGHSVTTASDGLADDDAALLPVPEDDAALLPVPEDVALAEGQQPPKNVQLQGRASFKHNGSAYMMPGIGKRKDKETKQKVRDQLDGYFRSERVRQMMRATRQARDSFESAVLKNSEDLGEVPDAPPQEALDVPNTSGRVTTEFAFSLDRHTV